MGSIPTVNLSDASKVKKATNLLIHLRLEMKNMESINLWDDDSISFDVANNGGMYGRVVKDGTFIADSLAEFADYAYGGGFHSFYANENEELLVQSLTPIQFGEYKYLIAEVWKHGKLWYMDSRNLEPLPKKNPPSKLISPNTLIKDGPCPHLTISFPDHQAKKVFEDWISQRENDFQQFVTANKKRLCYENDLEFLYKLPEFENSNHIANFALNIMCIGIAKENFQLPI